MEFSIFFLFFLTLPLIAILNQLDFQNLSVRGLSLTCGYWGFSGLFLSRTNELKFFFESYRAVVTLYCAVRPVRSLSTL